MWIRSLFCLFINSIIKRKADFRYFIIFFVKGKLAEKWGRKASGLTGNLRRLGRQRENGVISFKGIAFFTYLNEDLF